jgi:hypothetical protein
MGMSKRDIDKLLGLPETYLSPDGSEYYKYDDVMAGYMDERLALFSLGEQSSMSNGISLATNPADAAKKLGTASIPNSLTYGYRWDNKQGLLEMINGAEALKQLEGQSNLYELQLAANAIGDLYSIQIVRSDYTAAMKERVAQINAAAMPIEPAQPITAADMAMVREENGTKIAITLGMSRKEVEAIVGAPLIETNFGISYDGIKVGYRDDRVVALTIKLGDESKTIYKTARGAGVLNSRQVIEAMYGEPTSYKQPYLNYLLSSQGNNGSLHVITAEELEQQKIKPAYYLSLLIGDSSEERVEFLSISDFQYAMTGE